ncbi:hypothetical protein TruAng_004839 [Truncatella angustata]|nr:hypothetical protein TruAng_004839 [Truncatella angustata]
MDGILEQSWWYASIRVAICGALAFAAFPSCLDLFLIVSGSTLSPEYLARSSNAYRDYPGYGNAAKGIDTYVRSKLTGSTLSFDTLSALQTIHAKSANVFKGDEFYGLLDGGAEGGQSIQMTQDSESHAARRRVLDRMMPSREKSFHIINDLAQKFTSVVWEDAGRNGGLIDVNNAAAWYAFDVITTIAFGRSMDMLRYAKFRWVPMCLQDASLFLYWSGFARSLQFFRRLLGSRWPSRLGMRYVTNAQKYQNLAESQVNERAHRMDDEKAGGNEPSDIFGKLIKADLYSEIDLRADSSLLIAAGSDAVRLTILATLFYWGSHPDALAKATEEIRSSAADPEHITDATLASLKYLRACIDETMRLTPPKPSSIPREVNAGSIVVDGVTVPAGMTLGTSTYALHRNPGIYPYPHEYRPERWLERPIDPRMIAAFSPFLKGPRACPGKMVAYHAIQAALFHIVYRYDLIVKESSSRNKRASLNREGTRGDEFFINDWIIGYADGLTVQLRLKD